MKKLLTILSALVLTASASIPVSGWAVGASYKNESEKDAHFISEATSFAFRGAILNDQTVFVRNNKLSNGIDFNYATNYFGNLKAKDVLKDFFKDNQALKPGDNDVVSTYYGPLFGQYNGFYGYTIRNSIDNGNLTVDNGNVREGTNLYDIVKNKPWDSSTGNMPDSSTQSLISTILSAARIALGNDFSAGLASTLVDAISGATVLNQIMGNDKTKATIKNAMQTVDNLISSYGPALNNAVLNLTQTNMSDGTLKDKLLESTNSLFEALIFLTTKKDGKALEYDDSKNVNDFGDAASRFWNHLLGTKKSGTPEDYGLKEVSDNLTNEAINQYAKIISFAMNLLHYYRSLDRYDKDIDENVDGSYLFDSSRNKTNGQIKAEVLNQDVLKDDNWWYKDGSNKYAKLNLQNLFSDISYFFSTNKNHSLRMINVILGGVYNSDKRTNELNPMMDVALTPLLNLAKDKASSIINIISPVLKVLGKKIPILGDVSKALADLFSDLPKQANQLLEWFATDGSDEQSKSAVIDLFHTLFTIAQSSELFSEKNALNLINAICNSDGLTKSQKTVAKIVISALQFISNGDGNKFIQKPWTYLFKLKNGHSLLTDISNLAYFKNKYTSKTDGNIRLTLSNLQSIQHIFEISLSDLVGIVANVLNKQLKIPDWLYEAKNYSISSLTDWIAKNIFSTTGTTSLLRNQSYSITSEVFSSLLNSLLPHEAKEADEIRITRKPVWRTSAPSCENTTDPFLNNPLYDAKTKTINIQTINVPDGDVKAKITGLDNNIASASVVNNILTITLINPLEQKEIAYGQNITYSDNGKSASIACFVPAQDKTEIESVSPVMAFFYSLESFNSSVSGIESLKLGDGLYWDYDIQLPHQDKPSPLIQNFTSNKNVNQNALKWLLGLTTKGGNPAFAENSLFQAISKLYGHNFSDGVEHTDMTAGARAIFGLASAFSTFASDSVNEIINEFYKPYLDEKNWKVSNIKYHNLFPKTSNKDEYQWITYDMHFYNYTAKRWYIYNIKLERTPYDGTFVGWKLTKLYRQTL